MKNRNIVNTVIAIVLLTVLVALYGLSFYLSPPRYWESAVLATVIYALYAVALTTFVPHLTSLLAGEEQPHLMRTGDRTYRRCGTRELSKLILLIMALRLFEILLTYIIHYLHFGYSSTFFEVQRVWLDFYHPETAFPLYGLLSQVFWIFTFNFNHARFIGSFVFTAGAGAALYALTLNDFNRKIARRAVRFMFFLPVSCLLLGTVPDGLFLLLSILSLLFMRKRLFPLANLFAMLAVTAHAFGVILFLPILAEYISYLVQNNRLSREAEKGYLLKQILNALSFMLIPIGAGLVLLYSRIQLHDAFALYREAFGAFSFTAPGALFAYFDGVIESTMVITPQTLPTLAVTAVPTVLYLFGACILILIGCGKIDTSYVLMMVASVPLILFMNKTEAAAGLLTVVAPFYIALAAAIKKRWLNYTLLILFALSWFGYLYAFIIGNTGGVI